MNKMLGFVVPRETYTYVPQSGITIRKILLTIKYTIRKFQSFSIIAAEIYRFGLGVRHTIYGKAIEKLPLILFQRLQSLLCLFQEHFHLALLKKLNSV